MAIRGQRPTADVIRLANGQKPLTKGAPKATGRPRPPIPMKGRAAALWKRYVAPAYWLADADSPKAHMWCVLQAEWEADPVAFLSARISQLRALGSELGFDPASRARLGTPASAPDPLAHYFQPAEKPNRTG